jgi:hypothetical protein
MVIANSVPKRSWMPYSLFNEFVCKLGLFWHMVAILKREWNELNTTYFCSTSPLKAPNRLKCLKLAWRFVLTSCDIYQNPFTQEKILKFWQCRTKNFLDWSYVKTVRQIWKFSAVPKQTDSFDSLVNHLYIASWLILPSFNTSYPRFKYLHFQNQIVYYFKEFL